MAIESKEISKPSETKQDSPFKMEPSAITGVFAGYELCPGCKWNGICMFLPLEDLLIWTYQQRVLCCQGGIVVLTRPQWMSSLTKVFVPH